MLRLLARLVGTLLLVAAGVLTTLAQEGSSEDAIAPPAIGTDGQSEPAPTRTILRFLTDSDYPPFNYIDEEGVLTGFNVDFARAICFELDLGCDIQSADWKSLLPALQRGETDAVIASIAATPATLAQADFSTGYYVMSGRFAARKDREKIEITPIRMEALRVGALKGGAHEAYLQTFFPDVLIVPFETDDAARAALIKGDIDYLFGDSIGLMFWLNGSAAAACCEFRGGAFYDARYFGDSVGIAVRKGEREMRELLDRGIAKVRASGRYDELLQRYFPFKLF